MSKHRILCFGELLLRLDSSSVPFLGELGAVSIFTGGSEANVSASLAQWNIPSSYLSRIPVNELTIQAVKTLNELGVDTKPCIWSGDRIGLYFLLSANGLTNGDVVYDRKYSAFSQLRKGAIDWDKALDGFTWLHWSALTPALNMGLVEVCEEALRAAQKKGLVISVDLNYRNRLWDYGKEPLEVMPQLVQYCDVIMGNIWSVNKMLGTALVDGLDNDTPANVYFKHAKESAIDVFKRFKKCKHIAYTFRFMKRPTHNLLYGTYHTPLGDYRSEIYETDDVIDRIGSGDAFMAGLIYALSESRSEQDIVETATRAGFKKLFVKGDFGNGEL